MSLYQPVQCSTCGNQNFDERPPRTCSLCGGDFTQLRNRKGDDQTLVATTGAPYFLRDDDADGMTLCRRLERPSLGFEVLARRLPDRGDATRIVNLLNRLAEELDRTWQQNTRLQQQVRTLTQRTSP